MPSLFAGPSLAADVTGGFTNAGEETLFEAVGRGAVTWDAGAAGAGCDVCDLSSWLLRDLGRFTSRDELFAHYGQTVCWPARQVAGPVLSRWSAGARAS